MYRRSDAEARYTGRPLTWASRISAKTSSRSGTLSIPGSTRLASRVFRLLLPPRATKNAESLQRVLNSVLQRRFVEQVGRHQRAVDIDDEWRLYLLQNGGDIGGARSCCLDPSAAISQAIRTLSEMPRSSG